MCNCKSMVRTFEETLEGRLPASTHAPACEDYKTQRYIRLFNDDGHSFIDTVINQKMFISTDEGSWKQEDIYMTEDQFKSLAEYSGL